MAVRRGNLATAAERLLNHGADPNAECPIYGLAGDDNERQRGQRIGRLIIGKRPRAFWFAVDSRSSGHHRPGFLDYAALFGRELSSC